MPEDNVYANGTEMWSPFVTKDATDKTALQVEVNYDLLKDIVDYLDKQITYYSSPESIPDDLDSKPKEFTALSVGYKHAARVLTAEKEYLSKLIEQARK